MLMSVVARAVGIDNLEWSGGGLRDMTRLAASPASMWQSVLASNSRELKPLVKHLASELASFADQLEDPDAVRKLFAEANRARQACK
jgi:prephenate dehydrogenase